MRMHSRIDDDYSSLPLGLWGYVKSYQGTSRLVDFISQVRLSMNPNKNQASVSPLPKSDQPNPEKKTLEGDQETSGRQGYYPKSTSRISRSHRSFARRQTPRGRRFESELYLKGRGNKNLPSGIGGSTTSCNIIGSSVYYLSIWRRERKGVPSGGF